MNIYSTQYSEKGPFIVPYPFLKESIYYGPLLGFPEMVPTLKLEHLSTTSTMSGLDLAKILKIIGLLRSLLVN